MAIQEGGSAFVVIAMILVVLAVLFGLGVDVQTSQQTRYGEDACAADANGFTTYNATALKCQNSSGSQSIASLTQAFNITGQGIQAISDVGEEQTTFSSVGVIGIVIAILLAVFGGFLFGSQLRRQ